MRELFSQGARPVETRRVFTAEYEGETSIMVRVHYLHRANLLWEPTEHQVILDEAAVSEVVLPDVGVEIVEPEHQDYPRLVRAMARGLGVA